MEEAKKNRGGARAGAGRKSLPEAQKKKGMLIYLNEDEKRLLSDAAKARGLSPSQLVVRLVSGL